MDNRKKYVIKPNRLKLILTVVCVIFFLIFHVGLQMFILLLEEQVYEIKKEHTVLENEIKNLEMDVATLRKGNRIKNIAHELLGMEMPLGAPETLF